MSPWMASGIKPPRLSCRNKGKEIQPYDTRMGVSDGLRQTRARGMNVAAWAKERRKCGKRRNPCSPGRSLRMVFGPGFPLPPLATLRALPPGIERAS